MEGRKRSRIIRRGRRWFGCKYTGPIETGAFSSGVIKRKHIHCINTVPKRNRARLMPQRCGS